MTDFLAPFGRLKTVPVICVVGAAVILWLLGRASGVDLALWQLVLIALAAVFATSVVSATRSDTDPGPELLTRTVNTPTWRPFIEVNRWEDQFIFAEAKPGRFEQTPVKQQLVELVDERLRLRRGLSLHADPDQCRELLGESTFAFLTRPVADCPTVWQLDGHLQKIEEI